MATLIHRQYRQKAFRLSPELYRNLHWWHAAIGNLKPRTTPFRQLTPAGAHTDAQGYGHIAAVFHEGERFVTHCHLPQWLCEMANSTVGESPIFIFELCAAVLMVFLANEWGDTIPRTCVLCVDNQAAVNAMIKGITTSDLAGVLINLFWNVASRGSTRWWVEYVNAKSNIADYPSRQCDQPDRDTCLSVSGTTPMEFQATFASWEELSRQASLFHIKLIKLDKRLSDSVF